MRLSDFDFELPPELIARFPSPRRDGSRLLRLDRASGAVSHHVFRELPDLLDADDFLVRNNTGVVAARLLGRIAGRGAELLVVRDLGGGQVEALCRPAARFTPGSEFAVPDGPRARVVGAGARGRRRLLFDRECAQVLRHGLAPLPPYIKRRAREALAWRGFDIERYQTVYARETGSIAAPTAGLHFTPELLETVRRRHEVLEVTLDVGEATFQKIETEDIAGHRMGSETVRVPARTARRIAELKGLGGRLLAVGTTTVRSLESLARLAEPREAFTTEIFIRPGHRFLLVDKMLTNFHLPRSSLFILASAFAGTEVLLQAYRQAIEERYRFFSYGDAMLIV